MSSDHQTSPVEQTDCYWWTGFASGRGSESQFVVASVQCRQNFSSCVTLKEFPKLIFNGSLGMQKPKLTGGDRFSPMRRNAATVHSRYATTASSESPFRMSTPCPCTRQWWRCLWSTPRSTTDHRCCPPKLRMHQTSY